MDSYVPRNITVYRNGDVSRLVSLTLKPGTTFQQLREDIVHKLKLKDNGTFHLYTSEGIELYDDYIPLIRDEDRLFASLGEKFDQSTTLAEYKEISVLGEGGFGKVMLMQHATTGENFAVKYVDARKYGLASLIDMVFKEAELLKNLHHKGIVEIVNFFALKDLRVVFVMEYLEGGELGEYLTKKGRLTEEEAFDIFQQLVDSVYFCHCNNIIHRDLKLENILFESKDSTIIKVVDFGIAGFYSNMKGSESNAGSLRYMAPEVLTGRNKAANPAIDVWSMGVILYTLLHGTLPFKGTTRKEIIENIITAKYTIDPELKKNLSIECVDLLSKIFVVDYKARITSYDLTNHPWLKGERHPYIPSWYEDEEKPLERGLSTGKKGLKVLKSKSSRYNTLNSNIKPKGSFCNVVDREREVLPRLPSIGPASAQAKSSPRDSGVLKEPIFHMKKSFMFEEARRKEQRLATMEELKVKDFLTPTASKSLTPKRIVFPPISNSGSGSPSKFSLGLGRKNL